MHDLAVLHPGTPFFFKKKTRTTNRERVQAFLNLPTEDFSFSFSFPFFQFSCVVNNLVFHLTNERVFDLKEEVVFFLVN